ncbi:MAG: diacylglycerol kinase family lipid kinase, partial [Chloroflexi bacterium]|nr:diacylglycerol kinase family lipid kinase [Chloroflexota bacterium]MBU1661923.1 diacylglycerol kinase family lipid kinase [Chloroflexota bacterium]
LMRRHKVKLILNPNANMGGAWRVAADLRPIVEEFGGADWAGTVYPTHATELAKQAAEEGYELIIAAGGDGTTHEIINGLMQIPSDRRPRIGVIPLGSGNDFAHGVGMKGGAPESLRQIFTGKPRRIDIGVVEDDRGRREYIDNTLGIGFDAVVTIRSHTLPVLRGFLMYLTAVVQTIFVNHDAVRMQITTDEETWDEETLMLVVCNGPREGGGFHVAPDAVPDDGLFHYAAITKVSRLMMFRLIPEVMNGTHGRFKKVRMGHFREFELQADQPLHIHIDGEIFAGFGTDVRKLKIEILPKALEIVV